MRLIGKIAGSCTFLVATGEFVVGMAVISAIEYLAREWGIWVALAIVTALIINALFNH